MRRKIHDAAAMRENAKGGSTALLVEGARRVRSLITISCLSLFILATGCVSKWERILSLEARNPSVNQVLLVKCRESSNADAEYYVRDGNEFRLEASCPAFIGKNGLGKQREGDGRTPEGDYGIGCAFGILPNPGSELQYIDVTESIFACDEECEFYNTIIDTVGTGHVCHGEHMIEHTSAYAYGISIGYNPENEYPLGSAIFLHCKGKKPWTAGCVAVDEEVMRTILVTADEGMRIHIHAD